MSPELIAHLIELRKRLIYTLIGFSLILLCLLPFANQLYQILAQPLAKFLPSTTQLIATDITSPFLVPIKLTAITALIINIPNTIYQIWQFVAPGLYLNERKLLGGVIFSSVLLFLSGVIFCYWLVLPAIFHFIGSYKAPQITMLTDIDKYMGFVLSLFMTFGLAFEMPVVIFLLIKFNFLSLSKAKAIRKYMFVVSFIIAAIVTPPDVLSQTMLAIPFYLLYEVGLFASGWTLKSLS